MDDFSLEPLRRMIGAEQNRLLAEIPPDPGYVDEHTAPPLIPNSLGQRTAR